VPISGSREQHPTVLFHRRETSTSNNTFQDQQQEKSTDFPAAYGDGAAPRSCRKSPGGRATGIIFHGPQNKRFRSSSENLTFDFGLKPTATPPGEIDATGLPAGRKTIHSPAKTPTTFLEHSIPSTAFQGPSGLLVQNTSNAPPKRRRPPPS